MLGALRCGRVGQYIPIHSLGVGSVLESMISVDNIIPVSSEYQEIHPCSVMNIESVLINTALTMMI